MGTTRLTSEGFSLLEVLFSLLVLTVAIVALLHGVGTAFQAYSAAQRRWEITVDLWNRVEQSRVSPEEGGAWIEVFPQARPLYRVVLGDSVRRWETLHAQK